MIILPNAGVNKRTCLFILRLEFLLSKALLADVWFTASHSEKDSRGKQLGGRHGANVLLPWICQHHWGRMLTGSESAMCPGLGAGRDEKANSFKGPSRPRRTLLVLPKSCWHARLAVVDNRRPELQQQGGQVTSA